MPFAEPIPEGSFTLRCGELANQYGDPWEFGFVITPSGRTANVKALQRPGFTSTEWDAVIGWLSEKGFWFRRFQRYKNGHALPPVLRPLPSYTLMFKEIPMSEAIQKAHAEQTANLELLSDAVGPSSPLTAAVAHAIKTHHNELKSCLAIPDPAKPSTVLDAQGEAGLRVAKSLTAIIDLAVANAATAPHAEIKAVVHGARKVAHAVEDFSVAIMDAWQAPA